MLLTKCAQPAMSSRSVFNRLQQSLKMNGANYLSNQNRQAQFITQGRFLPSQRMLSMCLNSSIFTKKVSSITDLKHSPAQRKRTETSLLDFSSCLVVQPQIARLLSSSQDPINQKNESRRKVLLIATYFSCFIGALLLSAIGLKQYKKLAKSAIGIEEVKIREYGRDFRMLRYRGYLFYDFILTAPDPKSIHQFEVREDDVWVLTFPKAGTTWIQEIVYLINNDLDFEKAAEINMDDRFPYMEHMYPGKAVITAMPSPRCIKSHLPFSLLPDQIKKKKPKIIYCARNPKDTVVSYYHFMIKFYEPISTFHGSFEDYCRLFLEDLVLYGPWWKHVLEAWKRKDDDNVLFLFYEDMKQDLPKVVRQVSEFLDKPLTESQVQAIVDHCSFDKMKGNARVTYDWLRDQGLATQNKDVTFIRKGQVGDWQNHLSAEMVKGFDKMVQDKMTPAGISFKDSLPETGDM